MSLARVGIFKKSGFISFGKTLTLSRTSKINYYKPPQLQQQQCLFSTKKKEKPWDFQNLQQFKKDFTKLDREMRNPKSPKSLSKLARQASENQELVRVKRVNMLSFEDPDKKLVEQLKTEMDEGGYDEFEPGVMYKSFLPGELEPNSEGIYDREPEDVLGDPTEFHYDDHTPPPNLFRDLDRNFDTMRHALVPSAKTIKKTCIFCSPSIANKIKFDPLNVTFWRKFMTIHGQILPRDVTGCCAKHQRKLSRTIKSCVHMGLMSYKQGFAVHNPFPIPEEEPDEERELEQKSLGGPDRIANPYMPEYTEPTPPFNNFMDYMKETGNPMTPYLETVSPEEGLRPTKGGPADNVLNYAREVFSDDLAKEIARKQPKKKE